MSKPVDYFSGKSAIITGGSSGIGKATAKLLVSQGANVFIVARNGPRLDLSLAEIEREKRTPDQRVASFSADVTKREEISAAISSAVESSKDDLILMNSAGIARPGYFEELTLADFEEHIDINYLGTVQATRAIIPHMRARGGGHIVNVSSVAGVLGLYGYTAYSASKFAVQGFSEALRIEMKPHNILVSVVIPNDTDTPQLHSERELQPFETKVCQGMVKPKRFEHAWESLTFRLVRFVNDGGQPVEPEQVATSILKGIRRKRNLIIPDPIFGIAYPFRGILVPLANRAFDRLVAVAQRET